MSKILNCSSVSDFVFNNLKTKIKDNKLSITLAIVQIGDNNVSNIYIKKKIEMANKLGVKIQFIKLASDSTTEEIVSDIKILNNDPEITGMIVQQPLPKNVNLQEILSAIDPNKDIDGLHPFNIGKLGSKSSNFIAPATAQGILTLLQYYKFPITGQNIVVIGRSDIVGKPISTLLQNLDATVTTVHSKTKNIAQYTLLADIIIVAVGKPEFLKPEMINENCILIDVGINRVDNKITGDIDKRCYKKAKYYTTVPGGIGPLTVISVMENLIKCHFNAQMIS